MNPRDAYDALAFGRSLRLGQPVMVAWGYGLGFRAMGRGTIQKINRRSVRVRLTEPVASPYDDTSSHAACWPVGQIITVVRPDDITNPKLHPNNTVHPLSDPTEALSYGVRCTQCGHFETACTCRIIASPGWTRATVGEHYTHPKYPKAVVSTFVRSNPTPDQMRSGYGAWVNYHLVGEFDTRELAQQAIEALLGG